MPECSQRCSHVDRRIRLIWPVGDTFKEVWLRKIQIRRRIVSTPKFIVSCLHGAKSYVNEDISKDSPVSYRRIFADVLINIRLCAVKASRLIRIEMFGFFLSKGKWAYTFFPASHNIVLKFLGTAFQYQIRSNVFEAPSETVSLMLTR